MSIRDAVANPTCNSVWAAQCAEALSKQNYSVTLTRIDNALSKRLRRRTTTEQTSPLPCTEAIITFIILISSLLLLGQLIGRVPDGITCLECPGGFAGVWDHIQQTQSGLEDAS